MLLCDTNKVVYCKNARPVSKIFMLYCWNFFKPNCLCNYLQTKIDLNFSKHNNKSKHKCESIQTGDEYYLR